MTRLRGPAGAVRAIIRAMSAQRNGRLRPRLSRTLSGARWGEYRGVLADAVAAGYELVSLETWLESRPPAGTKALVLRHDVDQHPRSALEMAAVDAEFGHRGTWYFRWRTAHPSVVAALRERGCAVGLHYETLSRHVLEAGLGPDDVDEAVIERSRAMLAEEVAAFARRHGPISSICPHGDTRAGFVNNGVLVRGRDRDELGIRWDGNEDVRGRGMRYWLTDRSAPDGRWKDRVEPRDLFARDTTPILCVLHPNNWASGASLWGDRLLSRALRGSHPGRRLPARAACTGTDAPPLGHG